MLMKYIIISTTILCALFYSCKSNKSESTTESAKHSLEKMWESDTVFTTVESAIYDAKTNMIYVSNIDGEPWAEDGKGSIGRLNIDGSVKDAKWITGLNCPKGLGITNGKLYVTDNHQLVEIDIASGKITQKYQVEGAKGLNDVGTTDDGIVYFTDSEKGSVYKLSQGKINLVTEKLQGSNGILIEKDRLLLGTWGNESLTAYNFASGKLTILADSLTQPDGIEAVGDGGYLVSSWKGIVHYVSPDGKTSELLNTTKDSVGTADIDYIQDKKMLLVPTFFKNKVVAYKLN